MKPNLKLPWFSKYLLSFFVVAFIFLVSGFATKPSNAAFFNIVDPPTWSGNNVTIKWDNPGTSAAVLIIVDWDDPTHPSVYDSAAHGVSLLGKTQLTVSTTDWNIAVHPPDGRFKVSIVVGLTLVSNEVIFTVPVSGAPLCAFTFTPTSVAPSGQFFIQNINGVSGNPFTAGLKDSSGTVLSNPATQSGNIPAASLTFTAPASGGNYTVFVQDNSTSPPTQCVIPGLSSNILNVGPAGPTPTPTPGTGCNITPANTDWKIADNVSGNTVTFAFSDPSGVGATGNAGIIIEDDTTGTVVKDSGALGAVGSPTTNWSWSLPNGSYCAAVFAIFNAVSTVVHFTIPSTVAGASNCPIVKNPWLDTVNNDAIQNGYYDSNIFTYNQGGDTFDFLYFSFFGCSSKNQHLNKISSINGKGALALSGRMVASLYAAPPASGVTYFAQKIHDLDPVQPAFAGAGGNNPGGIGYQALGPVQKIWVAFRNISYIGFILVFVIMGFMIMFRAHISPQAVATVQDSIPRIVVALILVTFSYAIAGFMIDLMFLFLNIMISALVATGLLTTGDFIFQHNVFGLLWGDTWKQVVFTVAKAIDGVIEGSLKLPGGILGDLAEKTIGWTGGTIAGLVVGATILYIMFRVFLMLLMAYVMIIILTIFAPFFFLIQALPGNNGAKEWFKQMASNVAVFPVTALMFMLAGIIGGISALGGQGQGIITPEQVGQFPLLTGGMGEIPKLIGIGFLLITPSAAEMVKNAMGAKGGPGGLNAGAAIGGALGAGATAAAYPARWAMQRQQQKTQAKRISDAFARPRGNQPGQEETNPT